jgi:hypothetical protein
MISQHFAHRPGPSVNYSKLFFSLEKQLRAICTSILETVAKEDTQHKLSAHFEFSRLLVEIDLGMWGPDFPCQEKSATFKVRQVLHFVLTNKRLP